MTKLTRLEFRKSGNLSDRILNVHPKFIFYFSYNLNALSRVPNRKCLCNFRQNIKNKSYANNKRDISGHRYFNLII